jgi:hypothetical protein
VKSSVQARPDESSATGNENFLGGSLREHLDDEIGLPSPLARRRLSKREHR